MHIYNNYPILVNDYPLLIKTMITLLRLSLLDWNHHILITTFFHLDFNFFLGILKIILDLSNNNNIFWITTSSMHLLTSIKWWLQLFYLYLCYNYSILIKHRNHFNYLNCSYPTHLKDNYIMCSFITTTCILNYNNLF